MCTDVTLQWNANLTEYISSNPGQIYSNLNHTSDLLSNPGRTWSFILIIVTIFVPETCKDYSIKFFWWWQTLKKRHLTQNLWTSRLFSIDFSSQFFRIQRCHIMGVATFFVNPGLKIVSRFKNFGLSVFSGVVATTLLSFAKRKACFQPEKTSGFQIPCYFTSKCLSNFIVSQE